MIGALAAPDAAIVARDVRRALAEDLGSGDVSGELIEATRRAQALLHAREPGVLAGRDWFDGCFRALDAQIEIAWHCAEGHAFAAGTELVTITGNARALLAAERSALNFLQTLSATATVTRAAVAQIADLPTRILDTRKTLPGLRAAQKYAVRVGGGMNHRQGLYDQYLIKENHILAAGGIAAACAQARRARPDLLLEVEVENDAELEQALAAGADRILLDEFDLPAMRRAVATVHGRATLEASGGIDPLHLREVALTGVDFISVGALTKHVRAIDLSLRLQVDPTSANQLPVHG